jgi:hypothetical protein
MLTRHLKKMVYESNSSLDIGATLQSKLLDKLGNIIGGNTEASNGSQAVSEVVSHLDYIDGQSACPIYSPSRLGLVSTPYGQYVRLYD